MTSNSELSKKVIKFISNRIGTYSHPENLVKWCELAKKTINYDKSPKAFSSTISYRLDRIEDLEGFSLMEKVRLVFLFSRRVTAEFVKELQDENCVVELNDNGKIKYFRSPDGTVFASKHIRLRTHFKGKPIHNKKKTAVKPARKSQNVRKPKPAAIPQIIPNPPVDDVEMGNEEEEEAQEQKPEDLNGLRDQHNIPAQNFAQDLKPKNDVDVMNQYIHQEPPYNGPINYDDLDNMEHPEFMVPVEYQPPIQHNKRHQNASQENRERLEVGKPKKSELFNSPEINDVEMRNGEEELPIQEEALEQILMQNPENLDDLAPAVNDNLNIQNQVAEEEIEQEPEVLAQEEKPGMLPLETISLLKLAEQIEILSFNVNLDESFQQKVLRALSLFEANDQTISVQHFNRYFDAIFTSLKTEKHQNSTRKSIKIVTIFKHLQRNLIRPLGEHMMADTLKLLEEEIEKLEGIEDEVPLNTVQTKLDSLMHFATSAWANLD